jgi:uncharacterized protein
MKILLNVIGSIAVVLAILGVFLPLLPTTPFLLLASACYIRGSERMHRRLMNHRLFGEYLRNIQDRRGMPLRGKVITLVLMWVSLAYSIYTVNAMLLKGLLVAIGIGVTVFILRMKTLENTLDSTTREVD